MKYVLLGATALLLMACHSGNTVPTGSSLSKPLISVSATGVSAQAPDTASVSAGVITQGKTAGAAMQANANQMEAVFEHLKSAGILPKNIQTSQLSLKPRYNYQNRQAPTLEGYEARNTVSVKTDNIAAVGPMLDALVKAGVNNIYGVQFSVKDSEAAEATAREEAIKIAKAKAESMAEAAGVKLGKLQSLSEGGGGYTPQPMPMARMSMAMDSVAETQISAGEHSVRIVVNMTYAIKE